MNFIYMILIFPNMNYPLIIPVPMKKVINPFFIWSVTRKLWGIKSDITMQLDSEVKLLNDPSSKIKYNYDFGDNWQHYIEVVNVLSNFEYPYPICIGGEGNTPPEDVGGEYGYEEFLAILADPGHPELRSYSNMGKRARL